MSPSPLYECALRVNCVASCTRMVTHMYAFMFVCAHTRQCLSSCTPQPPPPQKEWKIKKRRGRKMLSHRWLRNIMTRVGDKLSACGGYFQADKAR